MEKQDCLKKLHECLKPGDTVYTVLRHCSRSGMFRKIDLYIIQNGEPVRISYYAALAMGEKIDRDTGAVSVGGCGMDMGFHLVYNLGRVMFPNGYVCGGKICNSNDHTNGDRNYRKHNHKDGGYAFRHSWL